MDRYAHRFMRTILNCKKLSLVMLIITASGMFGCIEKTSVVSVPEAENALFSEDGRFFVTGGESIYEITKDEYGTYTKHRLYLKVYNFLGIGQYGNNIYVNRTNPGAGFIFNPDSHLLIADLDDLSLSAEENEANGVFTEIKLNTIEGPVNGMAIDSNGCIYIADMAGGRIMSSLIPGGDPASIGEFSEWLDEGVNSPNGITIKETMLYFTDGSSVKKVEIQGDGSPGEVDTIGADLGMLDDLIPFRDGVIVTAFYGGMILYITHEGQVVNQTPWKSFWGPSSVILGMAPMFQDDDIIVTERGILLDTKSNIGNKVSIYRSAEWFSR